MSDWSKVFGQVLNLLKDPLIPMRGLCRCGAITVTVKGKTFCLAPPDTNRYVYCKDCGRTVRMEALVE